jgi:hypothetical protein
MSPGERGFSKERKEIQLLFNICTDVTPFFFFTFFFPSPLSHPFPFLLPISSLFSHAQNNISQMGKIQKRKKKEKKGRDQSHCSPKESHPSYLHSTTPRNNKTKNPTLKGPEDQFQHHPQSAL